MLGYKINSFDVERQTLELIEGKSLFDPIDRIKNQYVALEQYIGYLGPSPLHFSQHISTSKVRSRLVLAL